MEFVTASAQKKENRKREIKLKTSQKKKKKEEIYILEFFSFKGSDPVANSLSHASFILQGCEVVRAHLLQVDSLLVGVHAEGIRAHNKDTAAHEQTDPEETQGESQVSEHAVDEDDGHLHHQQHGPHQHPRPHELVLFCSHSMDEHTRHADVQEAFHDDSGSFFIWLDNDIQNYNGEEEYDLTGGEDERARPQREAAAAIHHQQRFPVAAAATHPRPRRGGNGS